MILYQSVLTLLQLTKNHILSQFVLNITFSQLSFSLGYFSRWLIISSIFNESTCLVLESVIIHFWSFVTDNLGFFWSSMNWITHLALGIASHSNVIWSGDVTKSKCNFQLSSTLVLYNSVWNHSTCFQCIDVGTLSNLAILIEAGSHQSNIDAIVVSNIFRSSLDIFHNSFLSSGLTKQYRCHHHPDFTT